MKPLVFACMPQYSNVVDGRALDSLLASSVKHEIRFGNPFSDVGGSPIRVSSSLINHNFNIIWAMAWNLRQKYRFDYFAMLHADIQAEYGWVDVLIDELNRTGGDVVSAVVALKLKDGSGLSSTAIADIGICEPDRVTPEECVRKLTFHEIHKLPETFTGEDVEPGKVLLWNTGCWVARLDRPWYNARQPDNPRALAFRFRSLDEVYILDDGTASAECRGEDWSAAMILHRLGGKAYCTRKVKTSHFGEFPYTNFPAWGRLETDVAYYDKLKARRSKLVAVDAGQQVNGAGVGAIAGLEDNRIAPMQPGAQV